MDKDKIFKTSMLIYSVVIILVGLYLSKNLILWRREEKSNIEVVDTNKLKISLKGLSKRNYSIKISEVKIDDFTFGNRDPF